MIVFDLDCANEHRFEGWFGSSEDFSEQQARGLLTCPTCGSAEIIKAPMAPAIGAKGDRASHEGSAALEASVRDRKPDASVTNQTMPPELAKAFATIAKAQAKLLKKSAWVGEKFADEARSMHYGEKDEKPIHGKANAKEARDLMEEGITVAPLLVPVTPPDELN
ncbi:MAG: DUF1178 family protein [Erythrobacter sp.]|nr:DUF1178 family protein [Erythrobacter sp.]